MHVWIFSRGYRVAVVWRRSPRNMRSAMVAPPVEGHQSTVSHPTMPSKATSHPNVSLLGSRAKLSFNGRCFQNLFLSVYHFFLSVTKCRKRFFPAMFAEVWGVTRPRNCSFCFCGPCVLLFCTYDSQVPKRNSGGCFWLCMLQGFPKTCPETRSRLP